jgi:hypothetical protein
MANKMKHLCFPLGLFKIYFKGYLNARWFLKIFKALMIQERKLGE